MIQVIRNIMIYAICLRVYDVQSIAGTNQRFVKKYFSQIHGMRVYTLL